MKKVFSKIYDLAYWEVWNRLKKNNQGFFCQFYPEK